MWRARQGRRGGLTGEIDISNADRPRASDRAEVDNDAAGLVLDLGGLEFMDSSGVHMLFALAGRLRHRDQRFALVIGARQPAPPRARAERPGARSWIYDSEDAAIAAVLAEP